MNVDPRLQPLRGIVPPMATPLAAPDRLDVPGLENLVEHILAGGAHGLFLLGTTGEGPALGYKLRMELVTRVCRQVGRRVPVLVAITDAAYTETLHMAEAAARAGAAAVVMAPPFYYPFTQADILRLMEGLARDSALPLYLYNQPALTKVSIHPETVARAAEIPNVVGVKDSSGEIAYVQDVVPRVARRPEFSVLVGPEHLLAQALRSGAHGGVPGGANLFPALPVRVYQAFREGRYDEMEAAQAELIEAGSPIWNGGGEGAPHLRRLKCALSVLGICSGLLAWPWLPSPAPERQHIENHLRRLGLLEVRT